MHDAAGKVPSLPLWLVVLASCMQGTLKAARWLACMKVRVAVEDANRTWLQLSLRARGSVHTR